MIGLRIWTMDVSPNLWQFQLNQTNRFGDIVVGTWKKIILLIPSFWIKLQQHIWCLPGKWKWAFDKLTISITNYIAIIVLLSNNIIHSPTCLHSLFLLLYWRHSTNILLIFRYSIFSPVIKCFQTKLTKNTSWILNETDISQDAVIHIQNHAVFMV